MALSLYMRVVTGVLIVGISFWTLGSTAKSRINTQCDSTRLVQGNPRWSLNKPDYSSIVRPANSYVDFKCPALGHPKPRIKWLYNGRDFERNVAGQWQMRGYRLKLGDLAPNDGGEYTCVVSNQCGSIEWTYNLEVISRMPAAPSIDGPNNQTVCVGEDAVFNCRVIHSDSHPHLRWLRHEKVNGSYTTPEGEPYVTVLQTSDVNVSDPERLVLQNVTKNMAGWYTCVAQNANGIEYGSAMLTVVDEIRDKHTATH